MAESGARIIMLIGGVTAVTLHHENGKKKDIIKKGALVQWHQRFGLNDRQILIDHYHHHQIHRRAASLDSNIMRTDYRSFSSSVLLLGSRCDHGRSSLDKNVTEFLMSYYYCSSGLFYTCRAPRTRLVLEEGLCMLLLLIRSPCND